MQFFKLSVFTIEEMRQKLTVKLEYDYKEVHLNLFIFVL